MDRNAYKNFLLALLLFYGGFFSVARADIEVSGIVDVRDLNSGTSTRLFSSSADQIFQNDIQVVVGTSGSKGGPALLIVNGGSLFRLSDDLIIGESFSVGTFKVDGSASELEAFDVFIGSGGQGTLEIINGGSATISNEVVIADDGLLAGDGILNAKVVKVQGGTIDFSGALDVADTLLVDGVLTSTGGSIYARDIILGGSLGSMATVSVSNFGSLSALGSGNSGNIVAPVGTLLVGDEGEATLSIGLNGSVNADVVVIGKGTASEGLIALNSEVDPTSSALSSSISFPETGPFLRTGRLEIGAGPGASGRMTLEKGASLEVSALSDSSFNLASLIVGVGAGSSGLISLDASSASVLGEFTEVVIGTDRFIGEGSGPGSVGTAGSGQGSLLLQNSSSLSIESTTAAQSLLLVGDGGTGSLSVLSDSELSLSGELLVGRRGTGTVLVDGGSALTITDTGSLGSDFPAIGLSLGESIETDGDGSGSMTIIGEGTLVEIRSTGAERDAYVDLGLSESTFGDTRTGTGNVTGELTVSDGARLSIETLGSGSEAILSVGSGGRSDASMTIDGDGTRVEVSGAGLTIVAVASDAGSNAVTGPAQGVLNVTNGAVLEATGAPGKVFMGIGIGSGDGEVMVSGGASVLIEGDLGISIPNTILETNNNDTSGILSIKNSSVKISGNTLIGDEGLLTGDGFFETSTLTVNAGGTVDFDGDLGLMDLVIDGGSVTSQGQLEVSSEQTIAVSNGGSFNLNGTAFSTSNTFGAGTFFGGVGRLNGNLSLLADSVSEFGGSVSGAIRNKGGTFSPGGSGTAVMSVGSYTQESGLLELTLGGSSLGEYDQINASGDIDMQGGAVSLEFINGFTSAQANDLTVLSAGVGHTLNIDQSVAFNVGSGQTAFELVPGLSRSQGGEQQVARLSFFEQDIAETPAVQETSNSASLAEAVDDSCRATQSVDDPSEDEEDFLEVCAGIRNAGNTPEQLLQALAAVDTTEVTQTVDSLLVYTVPQHGNLSQRVNGIRNGANPFNFSGLNVVLDDHQIAAADLENFILNLIGGVAGSEDFDRWGAFMNANINYGEKDATENGSGFDYDTFLLTLGVDYRYRDGLVFGGSVSYADVESDFNEGGGMDLESWALGLFGTYFKENYYVDFLYTYGRNDLELARRVAFSTANGEFNRQANANTDATQHTLSLGAGYDVTRKAWIFGPHLGLNFTKLETDRYTETGASGLNLTVDRQVATSFTSNLGFHASRTFTPKWGVLTPYLRVDWVHEFKDDAEVVEVAFASDRFRNDPVNPTTPVRVETDRRDNSYMVFSAGASLQMIRGVSGFLNYRTARSLEDMDLTDVTFGLRYEYSW